MATRCGTFGFGGGERPELMDDTNAKLWAARVWGAILLAVASGLFGIATEQGGAIVKGMATDPVLGSLTAFLVSSVYGIFPAQAMGLTQNRWPPAPRPGFQAHAVAAFGFFVFWAFYGLVVHRGLLLVFPKP